MIAGATPLGLRPDSWNLPLLVHVLGATVLIGSLILAAAALFFAWRDGSPPLVRLGLRALTLGAIPGWIVMRIGAEWTASKEDLTGSNIDLTWLNIGFTTADGGFLLLLIASILGWLAYRRTRDGAAPGVLGGTGRAASVLLGLLVIVYLVTVWAMTTKPT